MKTTKYRIVKDRYCGFQVEVWRWWWPFWLQLYWCNTSSSIDRAKYLIECHKKKAVYQE